MVRGLLEQLHPRHATTQDVKNHSPGATRAVRGIKTAQPVNIGPVALLPILSRFSSPGIVNRAGISRLILA
jgi:hypothetical protein